jgi:hypothetical protein
MKRLFAIALPSLAAMLLFACVAQAGVITVGYYRLGEADPGAVAGDPTGATTEDSSGLGNTVNLVGPPSYSSDVAASAAACTGSTLSVNFTGAYGYRLGALTTATDNFGIEGWFKVSDLDTTYALCSNGSEGSPNGCELYVYQGHIIGNYAGICPLDSGVAPTANEWFYVAFVRDNGVAKMYINNTTAITPTNDTATPITPADLSCLGTSGSVYGLSGLADEVRYFTFEPGAFNANTDLLISVPEPSTIALLVMSILGIAAFTCRKQKQ